MEQIESAQCDLPPQANLFPHQIAGHVHGQGKTKLGMLKHENGDILKPLISGDLRAVKELAFYRYMFENCHSDPLLQELKTFLPAFHGTWETTVTGKGIRYLCLEDVCEHFEKPSVLDVKIGAKTYDPLASEKKIQTEENKYPHAKVLGFRLLGMKVYDNCRKIYISQNKYFGRQQTPETIVSALGTYLNPNHKEINCFILCGFIHKLLQLSKWFSEQKIFAFYSSSLLFVYEGSTSSWVTWTQNNNFHIKISTNCPCNNENSPSFNMLDDMHKSVSPSFNFYSGAESENFCKDCGLCQNVCSKVQTECSLYRVVMIDFAHIFQSTEEDSNYAFGLNNLIGKLQDLLKTYKETSSL